MVCGLMDLDGNFGTGTFHEFSGRNRICTVQQIDHVEEGTAFIQFQESGMPSACMLLNKPRVVLMVASRTNTKGYFSLNDF